MQAGRNNTEASSYRNTGKNIKGIFLQWHSDIHPEFTWNVNYATTVLFNHFLNFQRSSIVLKVLTLMIFCQHLDIILLRSKHPLISKLRCEQRLWSTIRYHMFHWIFRKTHLTHQKRNRGHNITRLLCLLLTLNHVKQTKLVGFQISCVKHERCFICADSGKPLLSVIHLDMYLHAAC